MHILAAVAEFERSVIVERITAGLAAARERGVRLGRPQTLSRHIAANENKRVLRSTKTATGSRLGQGFDKVVVSGSQKRLGDSLPLFITLCVL
jgi:DNA invertase Pin-like site-specific DNA recombinase